MNDIPAAVWFALCAAVAAMLSVAVLFVGLWIVDASDPNGPGA